MKKNKLTIGSLAIDPPFISAPMAGVTNHPYRQMVKKFGASLVFSEMISAKAFVMGSKKTRDLAFFTQKERPIGIQIFGNDPETMTEAGKILESMGADIIDVNMGCPVPKILKTGAGAALLKNIGVATKIIAQMASALKIPVTVKTRTGWSNDFLGLDLGVELEKAGVAALSYHARSCTQKYGGNADWSKLRTLRQSLKVPVVGSGDIFTAADAVKMMEQTGIDGIMVARGALGNPWIFRDLINIWHDKAPPPPQTKKEKIKESILLFKNIVRFYGDDKGVSLGRKYILWFLKGMPNSHKAKESIMGTRSTDKIINILEELTE